MRCSLIEFGQARTQVCRESLLAGKFAETARDLPERFRPAGRRVGHQRDVQPLIAEVLRNGDPGVDTRFASRDGHVGGVGDNDRAIEQQLAAPRVFERREFVQHFGHFVAALAATDVNDDVGVAPLGKGFLQDGLARAEAARQRCAAAARDRKERIHDPLSRNQGLARP